MSRTQKNFFIGDFGPYKYLSSLAPFAISVVSDPAEPTSDVKRRLIELLAFTEKIDQQQHKYALSNFYEYQQLWAGMSSFVEYATLRHFAGLQEVHELDRMSHLKSQAKTHLHNFLLSQKAE